MKKRLRPLLQHHHAKTKTEGQRQQMQKRQLLQLQSLWLQRRLLVKMQPRLQLALPCRRQKEQINSNGELRGNPSLRENARAVFRNDRFPWNRLYNLIC